MTVRSVAVAAVLTIGPALLSGATSGATAPPAAPSTTTPSTTAVPAAEAGERAPTRGPVGTDPRPKGLVPVDIVEGLIKGKPIFNGDFADPFGLMDSGENLYLYATNTTTANIPVLVVTRGDTFLGEYLGDALPTLPSWTVKGDQWAPSVWARPDGTFVMYYTTPAPLQALDEPRRQCISRATANAPGGPFTDDSTGPMICPLEQGGAIDPSVFVDADDTPWLIWKADGNCCGLPTTIYSQRLAADGLSTAGPPHELLTDDQAWQAGVVEGPSMVRRGDQYVLFFSANNWDSADYAIGVAECDSITGPCTQPLDKPWMKSAQDYSGPGGQEFFDAPGGIWMVHHGFLPGQAGTPNGERRLYLDLIDFPTGAEVPATIGTAVAEERLAWWSLRTLLVLALLVLASVVGVRRWRRRRSAIAPPAG